jgi:DeoR family transcriptional regulator of aga operon/DeoR family fructose operon transcriptional repressor
LDLLFLGGMLRKSFYSSYEYFAENMLQSISVNKIFLSADAVNLNQGIKGS